MIWVASAICILNGVLHYFSNGRRMMNIGCVISGWWGFILLINAYSPYDWYPLNDTTDIVIMLISISIVIGTFSRNSIVIGQERCILNNKMVLGVERDDIGSLFWIVQYVLIILLIPMVIRAFIILQNNSFSMYYLRTAYANGASEGSFMNTFERMFYIHYIVGPFCNAFTIIDMIICFSNKFWKKPFICAVLMVVLRTIYTGGRTLIFMMLLIIVVVFSVYKNLSNNIIEEKSIKSKTRKPAIIMIILLGTITVARNNTDSNPFFEIIQTLIQYFGAGIRVLNSILLTPDHYGFNGYTYGSVTFAGLLSIFRTIDIYFFKPLGIGLFPLNFDPYSISQGYVATNIHYGTSSYMNAFPTMAYYFLRDGGYVGLVLLTVVFLKICSRKERRYYRTRSLFNAFLYILLFYVVIMSVCWWEPVNVEFWMELFWGYFICRAIVHKNITALRH